MPTEEQANEQWVSKIKKLAEQDEASDTPKEASYEEMTLLYMTKAIETMRRGKPDNRSEVARRYAISITEMEKAYAYFKTWVADFTD